ncbi:MAG: transcriptional repressor [Deltaproteobacteria bacterium]|nr:transcriptional repressor [Deltaproteobacteria bacterium]
MQINYNNNRYDISNSFSVHDHFDVDELFLRMRDQKSKIAKASIYRAIPLLIESGLIKEAFFEDGHLHYEPIYGHSHHCHLRCICCGKVVEFVEEEMDNIVDRLSKKHNFNILDHRLDFTGYCSECNNKMNAQNNVSVQN